MKKLRQDGGYGVNTKAKLYTSTTETENKRFLNNGSMIFDNRTPLTTTETVDKAEALKTVLTSSIAIEYNGVYDGISAYCPILQWNQLNTVADKRAALNEALAALVDRANASPMGSEKGQYINLYLPGLGGYMGLVMHSYDRPSAQTK